MTDRTPNPYQHLLSQAGNCYLENPLGYPAVVTERAREINAYALTTGFQHEVRLTYSEDDDTVYLRFGPTYSSSGDTFELWERVPLFSNLRSAMEEATGRPLHRIFLRHTSLIEYTTADYKFSYKLSDGSYVKGFTGAEYSPNFPLVLPVGYIGVGYEYYSSAARDSVRIDSLDFAGERRFHLDANPITFELSSVEEVFNFMRDNGLPNIQMHPDAPAPMEQRFVCTHPDFEKWQSGYNAGISDSSSEVLEYSNQNQALYNENQSLRNAVRVLNDAWQQCREGDNNL